MRFATSLALIVVVICAAQVNAQAAAFPGASGMAWVPEAGQYLCVQDLKTPDATGRFGLLRGSGMPACEYTDIAVDWNDNQVASDLEALCPIPGSPGEFLACESGYWMGKFGRLFHVRLLQNGSATLVSRAAYAGSYSQSGAAADPPPPADVWSIDVLRAIQLPVLSAQIEGIACVRKSSGGLLLLLGERGGDTAYSSASILWADLDLGAGTIYLSPNGQIGVEVTWPFESTWPWDRSISDLYVDPGGYLWISGADDAGDFGPFRSYIQITGKLNPDTDYPVNLYMPRSASWSLDGLKVEAIAAPSVPGSVLSYATDDELYGGIWRPLPPASPVATPNYVDGY